MKFGEDTLQRMITTISSGYKVPDTIRKGCTPLEGPREHSAGTFHGSLVLLVVGHHLALQRMNGNIIRNYKSPDAIQIHSLRFKDNREHLAGTLYGIAGLPDTLLNNGQASCEQRQ